MEEYKPNSHKYKEEQRALHQAEEEAPVKKTIKHGASFKKKNRAEKLADVFLAEDIDSVRSYVWEKIIVPKVKDLAFHIISEGANMLILGGTGSTQKNTSENRTVYTRYYSDERREKPSNERLATLSNDRQHSAYDYRGITFDLRSDAEEVLDVMNEIIDRDGAVSVADMCEMFRVPSNYTDRKFGWDDLRTARIVRDGNGYTLKLPRVKPI